jgi:hypothetical protein
VGSEQNCSLQLARISTKPFETRNRVVLRVAAIILVGEMIGIDLEQKHVQAQQAVIQNDVSQAVKKTQTPAAQKSSDPWNKKTY